MIPTRLKAKLPRHLSYPLGAKAISEALADAPHVEALTITFWDEAVWPASEFRRLLMGQLPYKVMVAKYHPAQKLNICTSNWMLQNGWNDERWELWVYPVLAEFRPVANQLLREAGLQAIIAWLKSSGRAGWSATCRRVDLIFDPDAGSLTSRENSGV